MVSRDKDSGRPTGRSLHAPSQADVRAHSASHGRTALSGGRRRRRSVVVWGMTLKCSLALVVVVLSLVIASVAQSANVLINAIATPQVLVPGTTTTHTQASVATGDVLYWYMDVTQCGRYIGLLVSAIGTTATAVTNIAAAPADSTVWLASPYYSGMTFSTLGTPTYGLGGGVGNGQGFFAIGGYGPVVGWMVTMGTFTPVGVKSVKLSASCEPPTVGRVGVGTALTTYGAATVDDDLSAVEVRDAVEDGLSAYTAATVASSGGGGGGAGVAELDRLDLTWTGIWFLCGLVGVSLLAPVWHRAWNWWN